MAAAPAPVVNVIASTKVAQPTALPPPMASGAKPGDATWKGRRSKGRCQRSQLRRRQHRPSAWRRFRPLPRSPRRLNARYLLRQFLRKPHCLHPLRSRQSHVASQNNPVTVSSEESESRRCRRLSKHRNRRQYQPQIAAPPPVMQPPPAKMWLPLPAYRTQQAAPIARPAQQPAKPEPAPAAKQPESRPPQPESRPPPSAPKSPAPVAAPKLSPPSAQPQAAPNAQPRGQEAKPATGKPEEKKKDNDEQKREEENRKQKG